MNRQTFTNYFDKLTGNQLAQKQQRRLDQAVLPSNFARQVFDNARLLHEEREAWLDAYQLALAEAEAELAAVESLRVVHQQAVYAYPQPQRAHVFQQPFDQDRQAEIIPNRYIRTAKTIAWERDSLRPLQQRVAYLETMIAACRQEIAELRRIGAAAQRGDVALMGWLTDKWRSELLVGANLGSLPPVAAGRLAALAATVPTDAAGIDLPEEALPDKPKKPMGPAARRLAAAAARGEL
jgi:hypothetical protein